jgi:hypothetical protein
VQNVNNQITPQRVGFLRQKKQKLAADEGACELLYGGRTIDTVEYLSYDQRKVRGRVRKQGVG